MDSCTHELASRTWPSDRCTRAQRRFKLTRLAIVGLALLALIVVGCGGDSSEDNGAPAPAADDSSGDGDTASDDDSGGTNGESATDGDSAGNEGSPAEVDGVAIPLPPGADAVSVDDGADPFIVVLFTLPLDRQDATISFYDDWTDGETDNYIRTAVDSGGVTWQNEPAPGGEMRIIVLVPPLEGDDFFPVTLTVGPGS